MKEQMSYKEQYTYGLNLLKEDLKKLEFNKDYHEIVKYFTYPISIIEQEVEDAANTNTESEFFYSCKCEEVEKLYHRLVETLACISNQDSIIDKIRRYFQKTNITSFRK